MSEEVKVKDIEPYLKTLQIRTDRLPTFAELKKHYRDLMYLHPDKAGKESTENFQEISEAARIVFIFLVDNIKLQTRPDTNEGLKVLKCFENDSEVKYNKGNVVFYPDDNIFDAWMSAFEKKFGSPTPMKEKDSLFF